MRELCGGGSQQVVLGAAACVAARLEVDDARCAGEEAGRARVGELEQDDTRERLGVLHHQVAGQRGRAGAGRQGHGHEAARQAVLGGHQVGLKIGTVVTQRVHGALHEAEDRPAAEFVRAADDGGGHLHQIASGLVAHRGHRLEVLAGVGEHGLGVVQRLGRRRHVLRGHDRAPVVAHGR